MNPGAKDSNIKIFYLIGSSIKYNGTIDSKLFGIQTFEPINSLSIYDNHLIVSIGNKGIGYINLLNDP
jgi:hypothetical protein